jgi:hypothetical protein
MPTNQPSVVLSGLPTTGKDQFGKRYAVRQEPVWGQLLSTPFNRPRSRIDPATLRPNTLREAYSTAGANTDR